jgi:hypothetical protein
MLAYPASSWITSLASTLLARYRSWVLRRVRRKTIGCHRRAYIGGRILRRE